MKNICVITTTSLKNDSRALKQIYSLLHAGYKVCAIEFENSGKDVIPSNVRIVRPKTFKVRYVKKNKNSFGTELKNKIIAIKNLWKFHFFNCYFSLRRVIPRCDLYIMHSPFPFIAVYFLTRNSRAVYIYDAHEYYMGQEVVKNKNIFGKVYEYFLTKLEFYSFKYSSIALTVSSDLKNLLEKKYLGNIEVLMNVHNPLLDRKTKIKNIRDFFCEDSFLILALGNARVGLDVNVLINAIKCLDERIKLVLVGKNYDLFIDKELEIFKNSRYYIFDSIDTREIVPFIRNCDLGVIILDKRIINYYFSLPNKLFQYIYAGVPYIFSDLKSIKEISDKYKTGYQVVEFSEEIICRVLNDVFKDKKKLDIYKKACLFAKKTLCWDVEEKKFLHIIGKILENE